MDVDDEDDEEVDVVDEQEDELISLVILGLADNNDLRAIMSPFWQAMWTGELPLRSRINREAPEVTNWLIIPYCFVIVAKWRGVFKINIKKERKRKKNKR